VEDFANRSYSLNFHADYGNPISTINVDVLLVDDEKDENEQQFRLFYEVVNAINVNLIGLDLNGRSTATGLIRDNDRKFYSILPACSSN